MAVLTPTGFPTKAPRCQMSDTTEVKALSLATTDLDSASDFLKLAILPAGYRLVDFKVMTAGKLDTNGTPTLAGDVGLLKADGSALESNTAIGSMTAANAGSATGFTLTPGGVNLPNVKNEGATDRFIALDFTAAAATAAAGTMVVSTTIAPL